MPATLSAYNDALKRIYTSDRLEEQLYNGTPFLDKIERTTRFKVGEVARTPLHVSRNGGYTVLPSTGGNLNTAGNQGISKAEWNYTNHHQQVALQGSVIDGTEGDALSVANALDTEISGALTDLRRQLTRQLFGNGDSFIAQCKASSSNAVDLNTTSGGNAIKRGWIFVGQQVDVGTTSSPATIVNGGTVTAVDESNVAFTVDTGNITTEGTTHYVSNKGSRSGSTSYEMNGLRNIVSTSAVLGSLDPATQPVWSAASVDTTSQALSLSLILQQQQSVRQKAGDDPDFVLTGLKQQRKFYELLQSQVRYQSDAQINAGADDVAKWHGLSIEAHADCPDEDLYVGKMKNLFIVATEKPYWQNKLTGGEILSWVQGTDSYGAKLTYRIQLATNRRNAFARLGGLS
jgi:hypothetical protein